MGTYKTKTDDLYQYDLAIVSPMPNKETAELMGRIYLILNNDRTRDDWDVAHDIMKLLIEHGQKKKEESSEHI